MRNPFKKKNYVERHELLITDMGDDWNPKEIFIKDFIQKQDKYVYEQLWKLQRVLELAGVLEVVHGDIKLNSKDYTINRLDDTEEEL